MLAIKSNSLIQVWDCKPLLDKFKNYSYTNQDKANEAFDKQNKPMQEYEFQIEGASPQATCGCWLPTDNTLFAVGFDSSHLALFNYQTANIVHALQIDTSGKSAITCVVAHGLMPLLICGHLNGLVSIYDQKKQEVVFRLEGESVVQNIEFINNCMGLLVARGDGSVSLFTLNNNQLTKTFEKKNFHLSSNHSSVTALASISDSQPNQGEEGKQEKLPFFATGGIDGSIYIHEVVNNKIDDDDQN